MTPEEKAVIEAAITLVTAVRAGLDPVPLDSELAAVVEALLFTCPQCNEGGHVCPGDGRSIGHTQTDCGDHEETSPIRVIQWPDPWNNPPATRGVTAETHPCFECVDEDEDPAPWCDCLVGDRCKGPCRQRAHAAERCPNRSCACSRTERVYCAANGCHGGADVVEWMPATLLYALAGDRIRIGQQGGYTETDVLRSSSGAWHANVVSSVLPSGKTWDKVTPWEHTELRLDLSANPGFQPYPQDMACEIWMTAERRAVHMLMTVFPGTKVLAQPGIDQPSVDK